jgi:hypothetical protein
MGSAFWSRSLQTGRFDSGSPGQRALMASEVSCPAATKVLSRKWDRATALIKCNPSYLT